MRGAARPGVHTARLRGRRRAAQSARLYSVKRLARCGLASAGGRAFSKGAPDPRYRALKRDQNKAAEGTFWQYEIAELYPDAFAAESAAASMSALFAE